MARFQAGSSADMSTWDLTDLKNATVTSSSGTQVVLTGVESTYTFKGTFTAFDGLGRPSAGTVTYISILSDGFTDVIDQFGMPASILFGYVDALDAAGFRDRLTQGVDLFLGSSGDDHFLGGSANDQLFGAQGHDSLEGGDGDDVLTGGPGNDTLVGGNEIYSDRASYQFAGSGVTVSLAIAGAQSVGAGLGLDTLIGIEGITGSEFGDSLTGSDNTGSDHAEVFEGRGGNDTINGGAGDDGAVYWGATSGVTVSLLLQGTAQAVGGGQGSDTLFNIENLSGGDFNDVLTGDANDNELLGGAGNDSLYGGDGDDNLNGLTGTDYLDGGAGRDQVGYWYGATGGVTVDLTIAGAQAVGGGYGTETLVSIEGVLGSIYGDTITGNGGENELEGDAGADVIQGAGGDDIINGGAGDDTLDGGSGNDLASYFDAVSGVTVSLALQGQAQNVGGGQGTDLLTGFENLAGSDFNDILTGDGAANFFYSGSGDDVINGANGADAVFYFGAASDYSVVEQLDGSIKVTDLRLGSPDGVDTLTGIESLRFSISDTPPFPGVDTPVATLVGGAVIQGTGGDDTISTSKTVVGQPKATIHADLIYGGAGKDALDGGAGADAMFGGAGDDTFTVDNIHDEVNELAGEGTDSVKASVSYTLAAEVENLTLTGAAAIDGIGNGLANKITGNNAANVLGGGDGDDQIKGMGGIDILVGGAGADKLDGGMGADIMQGGADNDSYTVDDSGDQVIEAADEGIDSVSASATFALGANVENLTLTGAAAIDGTGNDLDNKLTGNAAANVLTGNGGADQLKGLDGADVLWGGAGADKLDGGLGADEMRGGADNDGYTVDDAGDTVIENAAEGNDTVSASVSFSLGANVENLTLTGSAAINGTGNELANTLKGNAGDNVLTGGAGKDSLTGGAGADTFVFGPALATSTDKISDFAHGVDHLAFQAADYGLSAGALSASNLVFGAAATDAHAEFIYDAAKKTLLWDADGVGGAAAVAVATFSTAVTLTAADFVILA